MATATATSPKTSPKNNDNQDGPGFQRNNSIDPMDLAPPPRQPRGNRRRGDRGTRVGDGTNPGFKRTITPPPGSHIAGGNEDANNNDDSASTMDASANVKFNHESVKFQAKHFVSAQNATLESTYRLGKLLGEGGFGEVYLCKHKETNESRAVKVMEKSQSKPKINEDIVKEYNILKELDHPNILKVFEMYETKHHFFIVTDLYSGGDLFGELEETGGLTENEAAQLMNTMLSCMNYCHHRHLVHLDLKPENILLPGGNSRHTYDNIKIIDFGLAQYQTQSEKLTGLEGSSYYMSPQVVQRSYIGNKADVWSCGVVCHVMMTGYAPFDGPSYKDILKAIVRGKFDFDYPEWDGVSEEVKSFIKFCLTYDEEERPSAARALKHPWLKKARRRSKRGDMKKRNSARNSLLGLGKFSSQHSKLKQATCAIMASQLLTQQEKNEIDDAFRHLDISCDGQLDKEDMRQGYKEYFDQDLSEDELDKLFDQVNFSGSGNIEYSEFAIALMMSNGTISDQKLMAAFHIFDKDDKGHISSDDIKRVLKLKDQHDAYLKKKILRQVDAEDTGKIEFEEFKKIMLSSTPIKRKKKNCTVKRTPRRAELSYTELKTDPKDLLSEEANILDQSWFSRSEATRSASIATEESGGVVCNIDNLDDLSSYSSSRPDLSSDDDTLSSKSA